MAASREQSIIFSAKLLMQVNSTSSLFLALFCVHPMAYHLTASVSLCNHLCAGPSADVTDGAANTMRRSLTGFDITKYDTPIPVALWNRLCGQKDWSPQPTTSNSSTSPQASSQSNSISFAEAVAAYQKRRYDRKSAFLKTALL
jgi:hypothetical protein